MALCETCDGIGGLTRCVNGHSSANCPCNAYDVECPDCEGVGGRCDNCNEPSVKDTCDTCDACEADEREEREQERTECYREDAAKDERMERTWAAIESGDVRKVVEALGVKREHRDQEDLDTAREKLAKTKGGA